MLICNSICPQLFCLEGEKNLNKKKIVLISSFIISIILVLICLYINTDFLKTKEQLFWKYFGVKKDEVVNIMSNDEIKDYDFELNKSSYIKEGNIAIQSKHGFIGTINAKILEVGDKKEDCKNITLDIKYNDKKISDVNIIKDENYYLVKSNLSDNKYVGVENSNLKQKAKYLGIKNVDLIPDSIKNVNLFELFSLSKEETKHISDKYISVCRKYVKNKNYTKRKIDGSNLTMYELQVSKEQMKNLSIAILDELYNDEYTLNIVSKKIQMIDANNKYCNLNNLKMKISEIRQYIYNKEANDEKFLSIIIYKNRNNVEKIEMVFENDRTICVENAKNKIVIKQYDVNNRKIEIDTISNIIKTIIDSITEISYSKNIKNNCIKVVDFNITCDVGIETININYNYEEKIKTGIDSLIRKKDIEYIELTKNDQNVYETIQQNIYKITDL